MYNPYGPYYEETRSLSEHIDIVQNKIDFYWRFSDPVYFHQPFTSTLAFWVGFKNFLIEDKKRIAFIFFCLFFASYPLSGFLFWSLGHPLVIAGLVFFILAFLIPHNTASIYSGIAVFPTVPPGQFLIAFAGFTFLTLPTLFVTSLVITFALSLIGTFLKFCYSNLEDLCCKKETFKPGPLPEYTPYRKLPVEYTLQRNSERNIQGRYRHAIIASISSSGG